MKTLTALTTTALTLAMCAETFAADPADRLPVRLPQDASSPMVTFAFVESATGHPGGHWELEIYANGKAVVSVAGKPLRTMTGQIPPRELEKLMATLLVENRILDCDTSHLQQAIRLARRQKRRPQPGSDAATSVIRIRSVDAEHEVRCHALGLTASQLPELTQVRDLLTCQQRLENVAAIIRAGGYENVNRVLTAANRKLRQQAPRTEELTCRELCLVDLRPDGTRYLQFSRSPDADGLQPAGGYVMVSVCQTPGQPPEITVTADAS